MSYILVVGDCPSRAEVASGQLFFSDGWRHLMQLFQKAGIPASLPIIKKYVHSGCLPQEKNNNYEKNFKLKRAKPGLVWVPELEGWLPTSAKDCGARFLRDMKDRAKPAAILCVGNLAFKLLTGLWGIGAWRGSQLKCKLTGVPLVPTYSPVHLQQQYSWGFLAQRDVCRLLEGAQGKWQTPVEDFIINPAYEKVNSFLSELEVKKRGSVLAIDVETYGGHITCIGIATSATRAICIPFSRYNPGIGGSTNVWSVEIEYEILTRIRALMMREGTVIRGQNFNYDLQYFFWDWAYYPPAHVELYDTMLAAHVMYPTVRKSLDVLASLYCKHYVFWKEDKKGNENIRDLYYLGTPELWLYNCKDVARTFEIAEEQQALLKHLNMIPQVEGQLRAMRPTLWAMLNGVKFNHPLAGKLREEIYPKIEVAKQYIKDVSANAIENPSSPKQLHDYFYNVLKMPVVLAKATKQPTTDEDALKTFVDRMPVLKPLVNQIDYCRKSINHLSVINMKLGPVDGRIRCSYNQAGTETFRLASSESAFRTGTNLQNVTKWLRDLFIPDFGFTFFECDLERADLQVVVWEAEDDALKATIRSGVDIHKANAVDAFRLRGMDAVSDSYRQKAKAGVHATNYGASPRTLAMALGVTVHEADKFQRNWFAAHPGIKNWQNRVEHELQTTRRITNRFGYRYVWLDRIDHHAIAAALAWGPQSTVGLVTRNIWTLLYERYPRNELQILLQTHDALAGQIPTSKIDFYRQAIKATSQEVVIPYKDPLIIPFDMQVKKHSWKS